MPSSELKEQFQSFLVELNNKDELPTTSEYKGPTLLWHDYESWGVNPKYDFPCQFASIRTDLELNILEKPKSFFCQIPNDYIPNPMACLVTGITPQQSLRDGFSEVQFAKKIHTIMSQSDTCVVGYNSIRYDDEVTRNLLYRNFYDPYEREWKNGNSRWDVIDLMRACYALRPEGIDWPINDKQLPSFRLEELTAANGISHEAAHDAISDVKATIAMAKLVKEKQPKLFSFYFSLRNKNTVLQHIDLDAHKPFLHISGMISAERACCSWFYPVAQHPTNKNAIICVDLAEDISTLVNLDADAIREFLYTRSEDLPEGISRPPLKQVHINKCPFVAPAKTLSPEHAQRLNIDREFCLKQMQILQQMPDLQSKVAHIYVQEDTVKPKLDVDGSIYARGFPSHADKEWMMEVRHSEPEQLAVWQNKAPDDDYRAQLFRYRGRNFPSSFDNQELETWQLHRKQRFIEQGKQTCLSLSECQQEIAILTEKYADDQKKMTILKSLTRFLEEL